MHATLHTVLLVIICCWFADMHVKQAASYILPLTKKKTM